MTCDRQVSVFAALLTAAVAVVVGAPSAPARSTDTCGLPDTGTVWIDYGEGSVKPDTRAVLARPGVVVTTSGTALPKYFRTHGAATTYFVLHLPNIVGQPAKPADPASIPAATEALYARAVASSACATPWIALNELFGSGLATPWSPTNAQYRANVLTLMQGLAAHGARPVLFVSGSPNVAADAAIWWQQIAQAGAIVYEAYYDAKRAASLGSLLGSRRMRLGMRSTIALFRSIGITPDRLGIALGFHSGGGQGAGGRQGLQPREAWLVLSSGRPSPRGRSQRTPSSARSGHGVGAHTALPASTRTSPPPRVSTSGHETRPSAMGRLSQGPSSRHPSSKDR